MAEFNLGYAIGGVALAAGVAFAGMQVGDSLVESKRASRTVTVKGLAEREVQANIATWRVPYRGQGDDSKTALTQAEAFSKAIRDYAKKGGLADGDIAQEPYSLRIERTYFNDADGTQREVVRYVAVGAVRMRSTNVDAVVALTAGTQELLDDGVLLGDSDYSEAARPQFLYTQLNDIKVELIKQATEAAKKSADQFATDSGANVGAIATANQGVIQILPRDGAYDELAERDKIVRVVSTIEYFLEGGAK